ncbi:hypothetical protein [Mucilaginibacter sp. OK098]|uniref:hypothetical protein n=1 Tax=Mucilaginibacter sp. OK098 TaxID=1855297 RepID=UPI00090FE79A|nr:hypothetical protein [Mucilaginibacter sp. OK098]SHN32923.1 hypothetical protein SAMN05216524_11023 [Mucilaginibacter sp. OK098]
MKGTKIHFKGREYNIDGDRPVQLDDVPKVNSDKQLKKILRDKSLVFLQITDKELFGINRLKFKQKDFLMLEPNPVTFYFSLAFDVVRQLEDARNRFSNALNESSDSKTVVFSYIFKVSSVGIIFSYLALEAFMNQMLPDYALINYNGKLVGKDRIQRWASFEDKINSIIPNLSNKNFAQKYPKKMDRILKLKKLRDELTHLKERRKNGFTSYDDIYQDILDLNLKSIVVSVKSFINFYHPGLICNYNGRTSIK